MERRGFQHHIERLGEALREEIAAIIEGELGDPRIGLATVSEVKVAPDGKSAHVLVSVAGSDPEAFETMKGLEASKGYIRRQIQYHLSLRHVPELYFQLDRSQEHETRIDELLRRVKKRSK